MKPGSMGALVESRLQTIKEGQQRLINGWSPYLEMVNEHFKNKENRELSSYERQQIAQVLENAFIEGALKNKSRIMETTYADSIAFLGVQLPVIAALLPSLVLNKLAIVQALDRRTGAVFYLNVNAGQKKGSIAAESSLISPITGHAGTKAARRYATELVYGEVLAAGGATTVTVTLEYKPVRPGTAIVTDGVSTFTDDGNGGMIPDDSSLSAGTINYTTGVVAVVFAPAAGSVTGSYQYNYEKADKGVPELDISLTSEPVEAMDFPLRAKWSVGAAIDLEKAHGLILEDELIKYLAGEIKFEIDHYGIEQIVAAAEGGGAADSFGTFDAGIGTGREWVWHKWRLIDYLEKASNAIFSKTLRGHATFHICGNDAARVIKQLKPDFVPSPDLGKVTPTGPIEIGTLNGRLVIQDPFLTTNRIYTGYKGDNILMGGLVYAPYIPLFATPTITLSDFKSQKGFLTASGFKRINDGFYQYGDISNLG